ncbi:hypothetical protein JCM8547_005332, partial [Rhodosporidiobolus lusitaniae]
HATMSSNPGANNTPLSPPPVPGTIAPVPPRPTPLPVDSHLRSADNYNV